MTSTWVNSVTTPSDSLTEWVWFIRFVCTQTGHCRSHCVPCCIQETLPRTLNSWHDKEPLIDAHKTFLTTFEVIVVCVQLGALYSDKIPLGLTAAISFLPCYSSKEDDVIWFTQLWFQHSSPHVLSDSKWQTDSHDKWQHFPYWKRLCPEGHSSWS